MEEELMISEGPNLNPRTRGGRRARDATRTREVQYMLHQSRRELYVTFLDEDSAKGRLSWLKLTDIVFATLGKKRSLTRIPHLSELILVPTFRRCVPALTKPGIG
jgi:hypothetical protein